MKAESFDGWDDPSSLFNIDYTEFVRIAKPTRTLSSVPENNTGLPRKGVLLRRDGQNRDLAGVDPSHTQL